jgi:hypothetical protein
MDTLRLIRVFISSPKELQPERKAIKELLAELNNTPWFRARFKLDHYAYEDHTPSVAGPEPQSVVDTYTLRPGEADIFICMLWKKMGQPTRALCNPETGLPYQSGTEYEFLTAYRHFQQHQKPTILLYRSLRSIPPKELNPEEFKHVQSFFDRFSPKGDLQGLVGSFENENELKQKLRDALTLLLERYAPSELPSQVPAGPDLRELRLRAMVADHAAFIQDRLSSFVGRRQELAELHELIRKRQLTGGYITITGQAGQGKSSIIARLVEEYGIDKAAHYFIPFNPGPDHQVSLLRSVMARLILHHGLPELYLANDSRPMLRDFFPKVLADIAAKGGQEVIFIDGLDQLQEDPNGDRDLSFLPAQLPSGIVCVLGTRPNDTLKPLELLRPHHEYSLPGLSREDFDELLAHREVVLGKTLADRFYAAMQSNALYLDLVARELAQTEAAHPEAVIQQLSANPENIFFLTLERLRRQREQWQRAIKPLLGVLFAAQEPLRQRAIRDILGLDGDSLREALQKLGGLLTQDGQGRYQLFHLKLRDYLRQDERQPRKGHLFDIDEEQQWHQRLLSWCEAGPGGIWGIWQDEPRDMGEQERRMYAREHYVTHLYLTKDWLRVFGVLDDGTYGKAKLQYDTSTRSYAHDLDLGCRAWARPEMSVEEKRSQLPRLWRYVLLRCSLVTKARSYPDELFTILGLKHREKEALELIELLPTAERQTVALCRLGAVLALGPGREREAQAILIRAQESAQRVEDKWAHLKVFNLLMEVWLQAGRWDEALSVAYSVGDSWGRVEALASVVEALAASGERERFLEVRKSYRRLTQQVNHPSSRDTILYALDELFSEPEAWSRIARESVRSGSPRERARQLEVLAKALVGMNRLESAELLIQQLQDDSCKAACLLVVARHWLRSGNVDIAKHVLAQAIKSVENMADRARASGLIISTSLLMAAIGDRQGALRLLKELAQGGEGPSPIVQVIDDVGRRVAALVALARELAALGQAEAAKQLLMETTLIARSAGPASVRAESLKEIADALFTMGDQEQAAVLYVEAGGAPLASHKYLDKDKAIRVLSNLGKNREAIRLEAMDNRFHVHVSERRWEEAIEFARGAAALSILDETFRQSPESYYEVEQARRSINEKSVTRSILILQAMVKAGDILAAREFLQEVYGLLVPSWRERWRGFSGRRGRDIIRPDNVARALPSIIEIAMKLRQVSLLMDALQNLLSLLDFLAPEERPDVLYQLISPLMEAGQSAAALSMVDKLAELAALSTEPAAQIKALRTLAKAWVQARQPQRLVELVESRWMQATTREQLLHLLPLASGLIAGAPHTASLFTSSFTWVDDFLAAA